MPARLELGSTGKVETLTSLDDAEFLRLIAWKRTAPKEWVKAAEIGDVVSFARLLEESWAAIPFPGSRVAWSTLSSLRKSAKAVEFWKKLLTPHAASKSGKRKPKPPNTEPVFTNEYPPRGWTPIDQLAIIEALPLLALRVAPEDLWTGWRNLLERALNHRPSPRNKNETHVDFLIRSGELPWMLAVTFADVAGSDSLLKQGAEGLESELADRTDEQGIPKAELLYDLDSWLLPFHRVLRVAREQNIEVWDADADELYRTVIERTAPLIQADGRLTFSASATPLPREAWVEILEESGWSDGAAAARALLATPKRGVKGAKTVKIGSRTVGDPRTTGVKPEICLSPACQSDEAEWALSRTHWGARADLLAVSYNHDVPKLELVIQGQPFLSGDWYSEIERQGYATLIAGEWSCVCWQTDFDGEYIELQATIPRVGRVERQIFLSRPKQFCLIAESISEVPRGVFAYRTIPPIVPGLVATREKTTRDMRLSVGETSCRFFPLGLPDEVVKGTSGSCGMEEFNLILEQYNNGTGLYCPILIDWSPARRTASPVWKSLTVTEERHVLGSDEASGTRLKLGNMQWLIYRSLQRSSEPRNVLGHQTRYETVIATVEPNGDISPIMQVE